MKENIYYSVVKKWFLFSIPFIFILGSLFHFAFEFTGKSIILAPFFPVNESIYEHLKLTFYPIFIWQLIGYLFLKNRVRIILKNWVISNAISIILSSILTIFLYYSAAGAFNIHSTIANISFYFISIALGQVLGLHLYKNCDDNRNLFLLSITMILCMFICFTIFTFMPPKLSLFMESSTGLYGI
ncbi:DUF6512 family protein [Clostridium vincentii]|uniref:Uncharacterized protein n=1 Tax=Clostridium vincentii TaxID=52704 RepID=A0A2T0BBB5_9CLOT|nr:DUF6512 family protein [Clostridium vincentii]PRR81107.1 hypothetical protein CLVI_27810 [Clostridium vincentii]